MVSSHDALMRAREAYASRAWREAYQLLCEVEAQARLEPEDLERAGIAAHLLAMVRESREALARGYRRALEKGDGPRAARLAFWLGDQLLFSGDAAQAAGWFSRARRALDGADPECPEAALLLVPVGVEQLEAGDPEAARATFERARAIGLRCGDADVAAIGGHGLGRALIRLGRPSEGMAVLDDVMVAVTSGEVSPAVVGDIYCGVMEACHEVCDLRRAREWTAALSRWCEGQPDLVPYRGPCLVYRAEAFVAGGAWEAALDEARRACDWLSQPSTPEGAGGAYYQLAELYRLRGQYPEAEEAYREASRLGHRPDPGLALLRLAVGQAEPARAAVSRALEQADEPAVRSSLLAAQVEILLALNEVDGARAAAAQLAAMANDLEAPSLRANAAAAEGAVFLAEGQPRAALGPLRRAWTGWQRLDVPYEAARVRVLVGLACRQLGDEDSAEMEFDAARLVFERLGAMPDLARVEAVSGGAPPGSGPLTARELEVLRLVAAGKTNREIALALVISEHTVARHLQNMFAKLDLPSRSALTAYAYANRLV
jgi:DNA-binding CsgD family transcriptional regulator/Tfp pilus assembly protein PilF